MKQMIFLILSIILFFIKCQKYNVTEAQITCTYKGWGKYHCIYYTRQGCCYVDDWCKYDDYFHRCEDNSATLNEKTNYEYFIKEEHRLFDEGNEEDENEEYEDYDE